MKEQVPLEELQTLYENISKRPGMYYHPQNFDVLCTYINGTMALWPAGLSDEFHKWLNSRFHVQSPRFATHLISDVYDGFGNSTGYISENQTKTDFLHEQLFDFLGQFVSR